MKHNRLRDVSVYHNSEKRGGPKESLEVKKKKAEETRLDETDGRHRRRAHIPPAGTSVEVVTEDRGPHKSPGIRTQKENHPPEDSAQEKRQVQKPKRKNRFPKGQRSPTGSDVERADLDMAEKISNKISKGRSGTRGSTQSRRTTDLNIGKRRQTSESEDDSDEGKAKKQK